MKVVIGAKPFNEQRILARILGKLLEKEGVHYEVRVSEPAIEANLNALLNGEIHLYVEYTGTAYSALLNLPPMEVWDPEKVFEMVEEGLRKMGIEVIARLGFRNDFLLATRKELAGDLNINTISDLAEVSRELVFSCPEPYVKRPDGLPRLKKIYGLEFKKIVPIMPPEMYRALKAGEVDVITAFATDPRIEVYGVSPLRDDKRALPPYEAVIIGKNLPQKARGILKTLEGKITIEKMRQLNYLLDFNEMNEKDVAETFLERLNRIPAFDFQQKV